MASSSGHGVLLAIGSNRSGSQRDWTEHTHGTDNVYALANLVLMTGHLGKPSSGVNPLRGQNNVQGASDAGLITQVLPDYQSVADQEVRELFRHIWRGTEIDPPPV